MSIKLGPKHLKCFHNERVFIEIQIVSHNFDMLELRKLFSFFLSLSL